MQNCVLIVLVLLSATITTFNTKANADDNATDTDTITSSYFKEAQLLINDAPTSNRNRLDNFRIHPIYDSMNNKILLNLTWKKPDDWLDIYSYKFEISGNSTEDYCIIGIFNTTSSDQNLNEVVLPTSFDGYMIKPGCTYNIKITINQFDLTKEVLEVIYKVSECTNSEPKIINFQAVQTPNEKLNISWSYDHTGGEKTINNITNVLLQYRMKITELNNAIFEKLVELSQFDETESSLIFNETDKFVNGNQYQLRATFSNVYNCTTEISTDFEVKAAKIITEDKVTSEEFYNRDPSENATASDTGQSSTASGQARNITINAVYLSNPSRSKIVLNVTWSKPLDVEDIKSYDFQVIVDPDKFCKTPEAYHSIDQHKELTNILLPPLLNKFEIVPACTYKIHIMTNRYYHHEKDKVNVTYTVPDCVQKKCTCLKFTPLFKSFEAIEISPGKLNISWEINHDNVTSKVYNITDKVFGYRPLIVEQFHHYPFRKLPTPNRFDHENYLILEDTHMFNIDEPYELTATFNNSYNCKANAYANFTVTAVKQPISEIQESNSSTWIQLILALILISFILLSVLYLLRRNRLIVKEILLNPLSFHLIRRRRSDRRESYVMIPPITKRQQELNNLLYVDKEIAEGETDKFEFPRSRIIFKSVIGEGAFGQVHLAKAYGFGPQPGYMHVAVKMLRDNASPDEMDDFLSEIDILKKVGEHANIVRMYGCCILKKPYMIVMEFVPCRDLKCYLLDLREKWKKKSNTIDDASLFEDSSDGAYVLPDGPVLRIPIEGRPSVTETEYTSFESEGFPTPTETYNDTVEQNLDHTELQYFALQIARGMEHLERIPICHRDLAARNILINEYKVLKISDFGLSRHGPYINSRRRKVPLRWTALEAIEDNFYDSKTDVWSFAVVLWEIGTLGAFPYEDIMDSMLLHYLATGKRLPRPEICTDELYSLMLKCWSHDPALRPSFSDLVDVLDVKKRRIYVDFNQVNPLYMFPPSDVQEFNAEVVENKAAA